VPLTATISTFRNIINLASSGTISLRRVVPPDDMGLLGTQPELVSSHETEAFSNTIVRVPNLAVKHNLGVLIKKKRTPFCCDMIQRSQMIAFRHLQAKLLLQNVRDHQPMTWSHVTEESNPQPYRLEDLKTLKRHQ
jgi:hypothetical protein